MNFYRYEDVPEYGGGINIVERRYYLVRETPKGYWISSNPNYKERAFKSVWHRKRWVSKTSRKRFAYPTKEQAMEGFVARKRRQVQILEAQLSRAKVAWAAGSQKLQPVNRKAKHLTYEAYLEWENQAKTPKLRVG